MLRAAQGCTVIFDGCKPLKMGAIRKPRCRTGRLNAAQCRDARKRRSDGDVEKARDGFFNRQVAILMLCVPLSGKATHADYSPSAALVLFQNRAHNRNRRGCEVDAANRS